MSLSTEAACYRQMYAESLILLNEDLDAEFYRVELRSKAGRNKVNWVSYYGTQLAGLRVEVEAYDTNLAVPDLWQSVDLWLQQELLGFNGRCRNLVEQIEINTQIADRLDQVYSCGDPLLTAMVVLEYPDNLTLFCRQAGLEYSKAGDAHKRLSDKARQVVQTARETLPRHFEAVDRSTIRPGFLSRFPKRIKRQYERKKDF